MKKDIVKREVRYAIHIPKNDYSNVPDYHYIKEKISYSDGSSEPKTSLLLNFKRKIWITKTKFQNHNEKKEFEFIDKLTELETTQSDINITVGKALNLQHLIRKPKQLKNSPYIYGYDVTSTSLIKLRSLHKNNFIQSAYSVAAFDIENDIDTKEILLITVAMRDKAYTAILSKFVKNSVDVKNRIQKALNIYLEHYKDLNYEVEIFDNEIDLIKSSFNIANKWAPDFLAIWNMDYDIPHILNRLKLFNVDPVDVICDQDLPRHLRKCEYKQGIKKKVTASGVVKPINPSMQWHTLHCTAKFYVIDSMCVYRHLRMQEQEKPSYSLDAILNHELNVGKLKFEEANHLKKSDWHKFMQANYPIEYIIYNLYDCLSMLELDLKTKDLSNSLPSFASITDFSKFNSNPKKIVDSLYIYGLKNNRVIGTVGIINNKDDDKDEEESSFSLEDELDDEYFDEEGNEDVSKYKTLNLKRWIITLAQHLLYHDGLQCIEEDSTLVTNIRGLVYDSDIISSYPSCTIIANVSKETTLTEIINIEGIKEDIFREQNLGLIVGSVNLLEYCNVMLNLPKLTEILERN